jgi:hypothetical protein
MFPRLARCVLFGLTASPLMASVVTSQDRPQRGSGSPSRQELQSHRRMLRVLEANRVQAARNDPYLGNEALERLSLQLQELPTGDDEQPGVQLERWDLLCQIGFHQLRLGQNEAAVESYTEACALSPRLAGRLDPAARRQALFDLAVAWMRLGETSNCVAHHTSQSCLLPIGEEGVHVDQEGSRKAIEVLLGLLEEHPRDLAARWILNIAYMTVGEYPDGVPEAFLVSPSTFESDESFPRFLDVAPQLGLNSMTLAGGVIADDFDRDGVLDLVTSSMDPAVRLEYFRGLGDGTFTERGEEAGFAGVLGGLNIVQADYDDDGWTDVFVPRGAWLQEQGRVPNSLLRNVGDGKFVDVAYLAGLAGNDYPTQVASWSDFDNDGDLDLFVGNENSPQLRAPSQLFENRGDGTFVDVAAEAGVTNDGYSKASSWGDYDADGFPDLFVSNLGNANRLYRNKGDGTFEDMASRLGVAKPVRSFGAWFWDFDNDGVLDLYVSSYMPVLERYVAGVLGGDPKTALTSLFRGDGRGGFVDVSERMGLDELTLPMGANFGDVDGDGYLDFYLGTGSPTYEALMPNKMFWNRDGKRFADVTTAGGFGHLQKGHGIAFADLDGDGDQDVFAEMGGAFPGDAFGNALFRNPGFGNHWIALELVGTVANRSAIGARIHCRITENGRTRSIFRDVNSGASFGANPLLQTIGLGHAERVDLLEIRWPGSGRHQVFHNVPVDRRFQVIEGVETLEPLG